MNFLLDGDGQEIGRDVFVDLDAENGKPPPYLSDLVEILLGIGSAPSTPAFLVIAFSLRRRWSYGLPCHQLKCATASQDPSIHCNPEQLAGRQINIEMRMLLRAILVGQQIAFVDSECTPHCQKVAACKPIGIRMPRAPTFSLFFHLWSQILPNQAQ